MSGQSLAVVPPPADAAEQPNKSQLSDQGEAALVQVRLQLEDKVRELISAPLDKVPKLNVDLQRLRVAVMVLEERQTGTVNPKIYPEMSLLNRMVKAFDFEGGDADEREARLQSAAEKLKDAGISSQAARAVVEAFTRVQGGTIPEPDTGPLP